jgi:hypothetical protein
MRPPEHFRQLASEAVALAERATNPEHKQAFEKIAASYLALAENAEASRFGYLPDAKESSSG